ncbi:AEX-3 domain-containing protein, partial [Ochromonadaceae sp. CCMP2298]
MAPIEFDLPAHNFPLMDLDFAGALRCLSVDNVLTVLALMLRESKILFVCQSNTMLTEVMETLRALLFPLTWSSCFVPRLPSDLLGLLQAPGGFMIGLHVPTAHHGRDSTESYLQDLHGSRSIVRGTYVVDLTTNQITCYTGQKGGFEMEARGVARRSLPFGPCFRLQSALSKVSDIYSIGPQDIDLTEFDSAFEMHSSAMNADLWEGFPTLGVRDAFFAFVIDFLGDYSHYVIPPSLDLSADSYRTFREEFAVGEYLNAADKASRGASEVLLETQMFSSLIQSRSEGRSESLVFFEAAGRLMRDLGLSAGGHGWGLGARPVAEVLELPITVYALLQAEEHWAGLSAARQGQLRAASAMAAERGLDGNGGVIVGGTGASVAGGGVGGVRHQLTYLSTGTYNQLRSGAILPFGSSHAAVNQPLDDLLTMWEFLDTNTLAREEGEGRDRGEARGEIESD